MTLAFANQSLLDRAVAHVTEARAATTAAVLAERLGITPAYAGLLLGEAYCLNLLERVPLLAVGRGRRAFAYFPAALVA